MVSTTMSPHARLRPVPVQAVTMGDGFWKPRMEANRKNAIPKLLALLEENGVVDNFRRLSGRKKCDRRGPLYTDSDLYKWMEACAIVLQSGDDPEIRAMLDKVIDDVVAAQGQDGYLNTWYVDDRAGKRFTNLAHDHELYCAGHYFQAAVAHYRATGQRKLLDSAIRFADYLCDTFGPGKKVQGHCGHPEIEMALIELARTTGDAKYARLAAYYLDDNGYTERKGVAGHAVRQMYLCAGAVDHYLETGNSGYMDASLRLWNDMVNGKLYITGGVGARHHGEAFGEPFELPNGQAYAETCAGIANGFWNWRMLAATGEAKYADLFERVLYNGFLSGVSLSGSEYFYVNPLASDGNHRRQKWYGCTCCPPNVQRMIASIPGYIFSTSDDTGLWIHLYDKCRLDWRLPNGRKISVAQQTQYPWDGKVRIELVPETPARFTLNLRIPGWCRQQATVTLNGEKVASEPKPGSYVSINRFWQPNDTVLLDLPMPAEAIVADERVAENRNAAAIMRGPVVYCLEGVDNKDIAIERVQWVIDPETLRPRLEPKVITGLPGGPIAVLEGEGRELATRSSTLYESLSERVAPEARPVRLTAIPYYAWANREPAPMRVWAPYTMK